MVRTWKFLEPQSGEHTLRVEAIGTPSQCVTLDGTQLETRSGQLAYSGPGGMLLRLKPCAELKTPRASEQESRWMLLVNERPVEQASLSGDGLRDLRNLPDGSYTIATGFDAAGLDQHACRKFKFLLDTDPHEVVVAHHECVWQVALDGHLVDQESHTLKESAGKAEFEVSTPDDVRVSAKLEMTWVLGEMKWSYDLTVGGVKVPASWTKAKGNIPGNNPPTVLSAVSGRVTAPPVQILKSPDPRVDSPSGDKENQSPAVLPQGVSYDADTRTYQANIKHANKFIFLGEFASADAAHEKYLEALTRYAPDKRIAPQIAAQTA